MLTGIWYGQLRRSRKAVRVPRIAEVSALALAASVLAIACGDSGNGDDSGDSGSSESSTVPAMVMEWVDVGDPGNACDRQLPGGGCGTVAEPYRIGKFEVTNNQYARFLNAVAAVDANGLYHRNSADIAQNGSSGSFSYSVNEDRGDWPVARVTFWNTIRFANWLHNGQPTAEQDDTSTEDGAYTLTPTAIADNTVSRNSGAKFFLPSEDEWYKAAYYKPVTRSYSNYPLVSGTIDCAPPGPTPNTANCDDAVLLRADVPIPTDVGSYTGTPSPYGTFDQGGNVFEWNESVFPDEPYCRSFRGGSFGNSPTILSSSSGIGCVQPSYEERGLGFRVASRPEPAT